MGGGALDFFCTWDMEPSLFCGSFSFWYLLEIWGFLAFGFLGRFAKQPPIIYFFLAYPLYIQPSCFYFDFI
jgi:hypothetical protein